MNDAHYHLIVNHLPIVGLLIGILVLIAGLVFNKTEVKLTALGIFIFSAITSIAAFYTGEGAEELVENLEGISETLTHTHEEYAETFYTLSLILGGLSLLTFILELKKIRLSKYMLIICLLMAIVGGISATYVSSSGGDIRHIEIHNDAKVIPLVTSED